MPKFDATKETMKATKILEREKVAKEIFSKLNKAKDFDGTNYVIDPHDYEEIQEEFTKELK